MKHVFTSFAAGNQKGAGELAAERQVQNALAGQQALAHIRGASGGGFRQASRASAGIGLSGVGMGRQAAMQDQQAANGMLVGALNGTRGQDIGYANANAQLTQNQTNLNDQRQLGLIQQQNQMDQEELKARIAAQEQHKGNIGGLMKAAGGLLAMSDERVKKDITEAGDEVDAMLDALKPYRYTYKDEKHGKGPRTGIMAQDMEKSAMGSLVVREVPDGKALDVNKALSAALASSARLNERVRKLEGRA